MIQLRKPKEKETDEERKLREEAIKRRLKKQKQLRVEQPKVPSSFTGVE